MRMYWLAVAGAACLAVGGGVYATTGVGHVVDQARLQFSVDALTVRRGETVTFTNSDRTPHNLLVQGGGLFVDSGLQQPGEPVEIPFTEAGVFEVACAIHPRMKMTVTVEE